MEELLSLVTADNGVKLIFIGIVYRSLKQSLDALSAAVDKLTDKLDVLQQAYNDINVKVAHLEESLASCHKRVTEHINKER